MKQFYSLLILFTLVLNLAFAQTGKDGTLTVTTLNTVVNGYAPVPGNVTAGVNTLTIGNFTANGNPAITVGDLVLIVQMQGGTIETGVATAGYGAITNLGSVGLYEIKRVSAVNGNVLTFVSNIINNYTSTETTGPGNNARTQVVRLPRFSALTVNANASIVATPWNGSIGGIVAIEVTGITTINGSINVSGQGFRGGAVEQLSTNPVTNLPNFAYPTDVGGAAKGESIAGSTTFTGNSTAANLTITGTLPNGNIFGRGAPANGGGGGGAHNAGGGGGANANNGNVWNGQGVMCTTCTGTNAWTLDPGYVNNGNARTTNSGGGRGGYNYSANNGDALVSGPGNTAWGGDNRQERGGLGGRPLNNTVNLPQNRVFMGGGGGAGDNNNGTGTAGASGGGLVFLFSNAVVGNGSIQANGNNAANTTGGGNDAPGGGGGGGTIIVKTGSHNTVSLSANGGNGGTQNIGGPEAEGPGGGGGAGYIAYSSGATTFSAAGGNNGITSSSALTEFPTNGATSGAAGQTNDITNTNLAITSTDIRVSQSISSPGPYFVGQQITITLTATNISASAATNTVVTDLLPAGLVFVNSSLPNYTAATGKWNVGGLAGNNGTTSLDIIATLAPNTSNSPNFYTNTATINSYEYDTNQANNTFTVNLTPVNQPPVITNNASAPSAALSVAENNTAVTTINVTDPEANTITYSLSGADAGSFAISTTGVLTFKTAPNFELPSDFGGNNVYDVVVRATDNGTGSLFDQQVLAVTVTNTNEPPSAPVDNNAANNTIAENATAGTLVGIIAQSTDPEASTITYSFTATGNPGSRFAIDATTGEVTVAAGSVIDFETTSTLNITVQASDGVNTTSTTFPITVTNVNESPVIISDGGGDVANPNPISIAENSTAVVTTVTSTDPENNARTYSLPVSTGSPDQSDFLINPTTGALTFKTSPNFELPAGSTNGNSNTYTVIVRVTDNVTGTLFDEQTIIVAVTNVNEPPAVVNNTPLSVDEGATGTIANTLLQFTDPEQTPAARTYTITSLAQNGTLFLDLNNNNIVDGTETALILNSTFTQTNINSNFLKFSHNGSETNTGSFGFSVSDGAGGTVSGQTFVINVNSVNDNPTIPVDNNPAANSVAENTANGTAVGITANATDPEGNTIIYSLTDNAGGRFAIDPATGIVTVANGTLIDFETATSYIITVQAADAATGALTSTQNFTINVTNINEPPTALFDNNPAENTISESAPNNATVGITARATDPEGVAIIYSLTDNAGGRFTINSTTGVVSVANGTLLDFESASSHNITVQASDAASGGRTSTQTFTISVTNIPPDTDPKSVSLSHMAAATIIPNLSGKDGSSGTVSGFRFKVLPTATQGILYINGLEANITTLYNTTEATQLTFDPDPTFTGIINASYAAVDGTGAEDPTPAAYNITITNNRPITTPKSFSVPHTNGVSTASTFSGTDADGNSTIIGYRLKSIPATNQGILYVDGIPAEVDRLYNTIEANKVTYDPDISFVGSIVLNYVAVDNTNEEDLSPATYTITNANNRPIADNKSFSLSHNASVTSTPALTSTDNGGSVEGYRFTVIPTASQGILYVNGVEANTTTIYNNTEATQISFDPEVNFAGTVPARYIAIDNLNAQSAVANYNITVTNIRPTASNQAASLPRTAPATSIPELIGSDGIDGTIIGFRITTLPNPAQGILYIDNVAVTSTTTIYNPNQATQLTFDPEVNFIGTGTFRYTAIDNTNQEDTSPATYTITVTDVNEPPVITSNEGGTTATITLVENTRAVTTVQSSDPNATSLVKYSVSGGADQTKFQIDANTGELTFISSPDFDLPTDVGGNNTYVVIVRATDNGPNPGPLFDEQEITVIVTNIDEGIVLVNNSPLTVDEGATGIVSSTLLQFSDPEKATLTFTLTAPVVNGTLYTDTNLNNTIDAGEAKGLNATFTQAEIDAGFLKYAHNGYETITDNFSFSVTDGTSAPITNQTFTVNVTPANDPPTPVNNAILTVAEGAAGTIGSTLLQYSDSEQAASALTYNITTATTNGTVYRDANGNNILDSGEAIGSNGTFTQDEINNNRIRYVHNGSETSSDLFNFSVSDGAGGTVAGQVFNITVTPVNDPPVVVTNSPLTVNEGALGTITTSLLQYNDPEQAVTAITYTVTNLANIYGTLFRDADLDDIVDAGEAIAVNSTFTQDDINKGYIKYRHNGGETAAANFGFSVTDGAGGTVAGQTFLITVTPVNDPPVVPASFTTTKLLNTAGITNNLAIPLPPAIQDPDNTIVTFRFLNVPDPNTQGELRVNNILAVANTDYQLSTFPSISFDPALSNLADVSIQYTVKDNGPNGGANSNLGTYIIPINGEPVAIDQTNNTAIPNTADRTLLNPLNGSDPDIGESITTFRFSVLPDNLLGIIYVNNIPANTSTNYTWADFNKVQFDPAFTNANNVTFTYNVRDNEGADDGSPAVFTIPIQAADQDADGVADVNDLDDDNDGIPDTLESNGIDPSADDDNNNIANYRDPSYPNGNYNSITMVNRLFDKDGDGIINAFDLDSDSDGITDAVEQAPDGLNPGGDYDNTNGRYIGPVATSGSRIGIPTNIPGSSVINSATDLIDFDGDGLYNFLDIDADNDGIRDYLEAQATPTATSPLRNPNLQDTDKDGVDNVFDGVCGCGNNGTPQYPMRSGVITAFPDYLNENSDADLYGDAIEAFDNNGDPSKVIGYSLLDLKDLAAKFQANAGNTSAAGYYNNDQDADGDSIPDWLEDHDNDVRLNHVDPQSIYYHDSDNDGWIDLFDQDSFGSMPQVNYAFRSNTIQIPLPAELIVFAGKLEAKGVQLYWETASETNNAYYEIERSQDGLTFYSIGRVKGAGTTSNLSRYSLLDTKPLGGTSYYRLKMVNLEGGFRHSGIIAVKRALASRPQLKAFPNPTTGEFNLDITALVNEEVLVTIMDITGQVIQTKKISANKGLNTSLFNITDVRTGTYIIIVSGANIYLVDRVVKY